MRRDAGVFMMSLIRLLLSTVVREAAVFLATWQWVGALAKESAEQTVRPTRTVQSLRG
jgi:hypothetical protein